MYVCMYVRMFVCMYVCMYVRTYVCMYVRTYVCMYVHMYVCMYVCMYVVCLCFTKISKYTCSFKKCFNFFNSQALQKVGWAVLVICGGLEFFHELAEVDGHGFTSVTELNEGFRLLVVEDLQVLCSPLLPLLQHWDIGSPHNAQTCKVIAANAVVVKHGQ